MELTEAANHGAAAAHTLTGATGASALVAIFAQALPVVQVIAGLVAIVTGIFAIRHYIKAARK